MKTILLLLFSIGSFAQNGLPFDYLPIDTIKPDPHYWKHIRNKNGRLTIVKLDTTVYGRVISVYGQDDGDLHFWMRTLPDSNYLVGEIICYKPKPQCGKYKNKIKRPHVGNFVRVKGDYVRDRQHRWNEIHPVKRILVMKNPYKILTQKDLDNL